jgi:ribosomal protein L16 Arg81 hydroxylase
MANAARDVKPPHYSHPNGVIDVARLYQEFADGSTIILPQLHARLPQLAALCRNLEHEFSARFQTNIYLTPGGAQGFKRHYDSHDVFILQIAGRKHWRLYDTPVALPLRGQEFRPGAEPGAESAAFTLEPGDVAYVPRGMMHDAESDDEMSLHITVGVLARTWHDLFVEAVSGVSLNDVAFRRSLPTGFVKAGFDRANARLQFTELLRRMADQMDFDSALDRFADELVATRNPLLSDQLAQIAGLPGLTADSLIAPRPDLLYRLQRIGESVAIHCYGNVITLPAHAEEPAVAALQPGAIAIRDLPGTLDEEGKLVLVRRLVREGLLTAQ